ncbi:MAG: hypothetical protein ACK4Z6_04805 [Candidatus Methylomirabilales bacterium]
MGRKEKGGVRPPRMLALSGAEGMARDRREILKRVPKLRKIKPPKPGRRRR